MAHERRLHHARVQQLAADVDLHLAPVVARGTRASAMDFSIVGEKVPLVISPSPAPVTTLSDGRAARRVLRAATPTNFLAQAGGLERLERLAADEVARGILERHGPCEPGLERVLRSRPCRCRRGSCRLRGAACRARRGRADFTPSVVQLAPAARRFVGGQHDLEAVFAGVAGACDEPVDRASRPKNTSCASAAARCSAGSSSADLRARVRALHRDHREIGALGELDAERRGACLRIHARSLSRVPALTTTGTSTRVRK